MAVEEVLSFAVGTVAAIIAFVMFSKFWEKRRLHHLLWAVGLILWATSSFAQGAAILVGWTIPSYKLYYFAAIALAGFLGAGTLGLISRRTKLVRGFATYIVGACAVFAVALALAPVDEAVLARVFVGGQALPSNVRLLTPLINIPGGIAFIGGALFTVVKTRKWFAVFITLGATLPALGGILARFSLPWVLPFTDFFGIVFLSAGVYLSLKLAPTPLKASASVRTATP